MLVDLEGVDEPVDITKGAGVLLDVVVAGACIAGARARRPDRACPVTAEGDVEDLNEIKQSAFALQTAKRKMGGEKHGQYCVSGNASEYHSYQQSKQREFPSQMGQGSRR